LLNRLKSLTLRGYMGISLFGKDETWSRLPDTSIAQLDPAVVRERGFTPADLARASHRRVGGCGGRHALPAGSAGSQRDGFQLIPVSL